MKLIIDIDDEMVCNDIKYKALEPTTATDEVIIHALYNGVSYEERPKGEWIVGEYMDCHSDILPEYTCPFCGEVAYKKYDFCHCGADMRGGRE